MICHLRKNSPLAVKYQETLLIWMVLTYHAFHYNADDESGKETNGDVNSGEKEIKRHGRTISCMACEWGCVYDSVNVCTCECMWKYMLCGCECVTCMNMCMYVSLCKIACK